MSGVTEDELDARSHELIDRLIDKLRKRNQREPLTINGLIAFLANIYGIPGDADNPAGPVTCLAADLLLRLVNDNG